MLKSFRRIWRISPSKCFHQHWHTISSQP